MSDEQIRHLIKPLSAVLLAAFAHVAQATEWTGAWAAPLHDPLLVEPPWLGSGKTLPGDSEVPACGAGVHPAGQELGLLEAINMALCHNPQVQGAWAGIKVQAAQLGEARAAYLPTLTAGLSYQTQRTQVPESQFQVNSARTSLSEYYSLTWRLLDFGGRGASRRAAEAVLRSALASHDAALQRTMANVVALYFDAQTAHASLQTRKKGELLARRTLDATRRRLTRGAGAQSDVLQAETSAARAELESARATGAYERSLVALRVALGVQSVNIDLRVESVEPVAGDDEQRLQRDITEWLELAQADHPALIAARAQLNSAEERLRATRSEGLPTLDLTHSRYINSRPNQSPTSTQTRESVVGLTLNIPLFDGFGRTYKVRGAEAQIEATRAELLEAENQILGEVAKAHADASSTLRNLDASSRLLAAAQGAHDTVRRRFDQGVSDILEMLSVQSALMDAEQERLRSLADWRSARLRLLANAGVMGLWAATGRGTH